MDWSLFWQSPPALFAVETLLVIALLAFSCRLPAPEKALKKLARHRLAPLAAGGLALVLRAAVLPVAPAPEP
jgi:hypothetical protein